MRERRPVYETIIIAIVVILTLVLGTGLYSGRSKVMRSNMLIHELSAMRSAIGVYKLMNHKNPASMNDLVTSTYAVDGTNKPFIDSLPQQKDDSIIDPFGNPYHYDAQSGWIASTTKGFERW